MDDEPVQGGKSVGRRSAATRYSTEETEEEPTIVKSSRTAAADTHGFHPNSPRSGGLSPEEVAGHVIPRRTSSSSPSPPRKGSSTKKKKQPTKKRSTAGGGLIGCCAAVAIIVAILTISATWIGNSNRDSVSQAIDKRKKVEWGEWKQTIGTLMSKEFPNGENIVARRIVTEALLRNQRQYGASMLKRAAVFHLGGGDAETYSKIVRVITSFVLGEGDNRGGVRPEVLEVGAKGDPEEWSELRRMVHGHVVKHPKSIVVLHRADQAPDGRLYDLEDAFENAEFEYGGQRTDCSKVIFVLETGFAGGSELAAEACGGFDCGEVHRDALVRALKKASQSVWDRQAFVARVREVVPFV